MLGCYSFVRIPAVSFWDLAAFSPGKGQLELRISVFLSAKQIKEALCETRKQNKAEK